MPLMWRENRFMPFCAAAAIGFWFGLLSAPSASAQPSGEKEGERVELEPVVITGTLLPGEPGQMSTHVTVIPGETVRENQSSSVTEALRSVDGLHVDQAGARGSVSSLYLRGGDPNYTVVMIDGIKVNDPINSRGGSFDFSTLNAEEIERIEIVRGSLSSIYGSDAISGAVNILTRRGGPEPETRLDVSGGSFGYNHERLETDGRIGRLDYALSGSRLDNGDPVAGSGFNNATGRANIGVRLGRWTEARTVFRYSSSRMEAFPDDSGGPDYAVIRESEHRDADQLTAGLDVVHRPVSDLTATVHFETFNREETVDSPGVAPGTRDPAGIPPNDTDATVNRYRADTNVLWTRGNRLRLTVGGEIQSETGESDGGFTVGGQRIPTRFEMNRRLWALFAEARVVPLENLALEAGARMDHPENFDGRTSPRAGFAYSIPVSGTRLSANWGKGFKLPSFFALSHPIVGNPDLVPERSQSAEIGLSQDLPGSRMSVSATYFYSRVKDAIDFDEGPPPRLVNREGVTSRGIEFGGTVRFRPEIILFPHLTYTRTDIEGTTEKLRNRPVWRGGCSVRWQPAPPVVLVLDVLYVGKVFDSSIPTGDRTLDPHTTANLSGTWTLSRRWEAYVSIRNLFDANYEEAVGFPSPGIRVRGGLRVTL
jgi:vitamin B12 transporter